MRRAATLLLLLVVGSVALAFAGGKPIGPPQFIPISIPGEMGTLVNGINNSGFMVGEYDTPGQYGFALVGSKLTTIEVPLSEATSAEAINSFGAIVGWYCGRHCSMDRGFLYQNGKFTDIGLAGKFTQAFGINDTGSIVGTYWDGQRDQGFFWDGQTYHTLTVPNSIETQALGINNAGLITVQWTDSNNLTHSSIYDGTNYTSIDVPGAVSSFAHGINNNGDVALTWTDSNDVLFGAVLHDGHYYTFMAPGANQTIALGINDQDIVVGAMYVHNGPEAGYKLIP